MKPLYVGISSFVAGVLIAFVFTAVRDESKRNWKFEYMISRLNDCESVWVKANPDYLESSNSRFEFVIVDSGEKLDSIQDMFSSKDFLADGQLRGSKIQTLNKGGQRMLRVGGLITQDELEQSQLFVRQLPLSISIDEINTELGSRYAFRTCVEFWRESYGNHYAAAEVVNGKISYWDLFMIED